MYALDGPLDRFLKGTLNQFEEGNLRARLESLVFWLAYIIILIVYIGSIIFFEVTIYIDPNEVNSIDWLVSETILLFFLFIPGWLARTGKTTLAGQILVIVLFITINVVQTLAGHWSNIGSESFFIVLALAMVFFPRWLGGIIATSIIFFVIMAYLQEAAGRTVQSDGYSAIPWFVSATTVFFSRSVAGTALFLVRFFFDQALQILEKSRQEVEAANQELSFINRELQSLGETAAHDLRTPLNAVVNYVEFTLSGIGIPEGEELGDKSRSNLQRASQNAYLLKSMIEQYMQQIHFIQIHGHSLNLAEIQIEKVVESQFTTLEYLYRSKKINFAKELSFTDTVYLDDFRVSSLVLNLLSNAAKYTPGPEQRGDIEKNVWLKTWKLNDEKWVLQVKDEGQGIPQDRIHKVFEAFERLGAEQTSTEGWGLGLSNTYHSVVGMDGKIDVESEENQGTTFTITLPIDLRPQQIVTIEEKA